MDSSSGDDLYLNTLQPGLLGLTPTWGKFLCEASTCCFEFHQHPSGVELKVKGVADKAFKVYWESELTDQACNAWNDPQELTEFGATGIAILLILELTGYTVIRRARKGSGIDYWLGHKNSEPPFQDTARLEISGILHGDNNAVKARVKQKKKQTEASDNTSIPVFIAVVEFSEPQSHLGQK